MGHQKTHWGVSGFAGGAAVGCDREVGAVVELERLARDFEVGFVPQPVLCRELLCGGVHDVEIEL